MGLISRFQYNMYIKHGFYLDVTDASLDWIEKQKITKENFKITIFQIGIFVIAFIFLNLTFCHFVMTYFVLKEEHEEEF